MNKYTAAKIIVKAISSLKEDKEQVINHSEPFAYQKERERLKQRLIKEKERLIKEKERKINEPKISFIADFFNGITVCLKALFRKRR